MNRRERDLLQNGWHEMKRLQEGRKEPGVGTVLL
jgi:hypothetical protein